LHRSVIELSLYNNIRSWVEHVDRQNCVLVSRQALRPADNLSGGLDARFRRALIAVPDGGTVNI
jgi:hypothetical protein